MLEDSVEGAVRQARSEGLDTGPQSALESYLQQSVDRMVNHKNKDYAGDPAAEYDSTMGLPEQQDTDRERSLWKRFNEGVNEARWSFADALQHDPRNYGVAKNAKTAMKYRNAQLAKGPDRIEE